MDRFNLLSAREDLAEVLLGANRIPEAEEIYRRSLAEAEKDNRNELRTQTKLADFLRQTYRLTEAEALYRQVLAVDDGTKLGYGYQSFNGLALLLTQTNRLAEAEAAYRRIRLSTDDGPDNESTFAADYYGNFADVLEKMGRTEEAEALYRRSLAILEKAHGPDHPQVASALNALAILLYQTKHYAEAESLHRRSLAIREKAYGPDSTSVALALNNLSVVVERTKGVGEGEQLLRRALAIEEKVYGPDDPRLAKALNNLALALYQTDRLDDAEPLMRRALFIEKNTFGPAHPAVAGSLVHMAIMRARQGDWVQAAALHARAKPILTGQSGSAAAGDRPDLTKAMLQKHSGWLRLHAVAVNRAEPASAAARAEGFELAQWALQTDAAEALAQMSARFSKGDGLLANLVRERESLSSRLQSEDQQLMAAVGRNDVQAIKALYASRDEGRERLKKINADLTGKFPEYAGLASPKPLAIPATQALLRPDEALIVFLNGPQISDRSKLPEDTLAWVITKGKAAWHRVPLDTRGLADSVTALRCGLDETLWSADESREKCRAALQESPAYVEFEAKGANGLPFDLARAHAFYKALLGPAQGLIKGKHLLIVPSGPLTSLPFGVLVTEPPSQAAASATFGDYRKAAWLGTRQPISVLPSVASLAALRRQAKASAAMQPFIGYGDPALTGQPSCGQPVIPDRCPDEDMQVARSGHILTRRAKPLSAVASYFRDGLANVSELRKACPLPDTAYELRCVARSLGAGPGAAVLGADMTETAVKSAPLNRYRVVHFATHGLLAGETAQFLKARAEPALVMSPPAQPTEEDDGLLTASEIAGLKLDADWVVLSACNTAGGREPGAEALSGLARAFFYAGARALLVSHWAVDSYSATMLTSRTFAEMRNSATIGRSDAFRRAMLALMADDQRPWAAHPSAWAPFVVVGEGAAQAAAQPAGKVAKGTKATRPQRQARPAP
jgi:CHAT domain-containing protein/tetratricopeptide (TPR) repeat protein